MNEGELITLLASMGVDEHNYRVLPLLPLVYVAWADNVIQDEERALIMDLAENRWSIGEEGALLLQKLAVSLPVGVVHHAWTGGAHRADQTRGRHQPWRGHPG